MRYLPQTDAQVAAMLKQIGAATVEDLFSHIPEHCRPKSPLKLPPALSEPELVAHLGRLGQSNLKAQLNFAGAGVYPHHIPAAVDALSLRGEFATAYTPYQAELSQGTLTAIFEFQTMVCELFGTEFANASMYDGASAAAEAVLMARRLTKRKRVVASRGVHPEYLQTCKTTLKGLSASVGEDDSLQLTELSAGVTDTDAVRRTLAKDGDGACILIQTPNLLGGLEDIAQLSQLAQEAGALLVVICPEPLALALVEAPGNLGADIVVGDGIGLSTRPTFGGPGVGLFGASGKKALRQMPGRLVGKTVDTAGCPGYVLTLSTREQHIRREKATSNICTNHGLYALRFAIHLSLLGTTGFTQLARLVLNRSHYLRTLIENDTPFSLLHRSPSFNEIAVRLPGVDMPRLLTQLGAAGIVPGVPLSRFLADMGDVLLIAVSEQHTKRDMDYLISNLRTCYEACRG